MAIKATLALNAHSDGQGSLSAIGWQTSPEARKQAGDPERIRTADLTNRSPIG